MVVILGIDIDLTTLLQAIQVLAIGLGTLVVAQLIRRLFVRFQGKEPERAARNLSRILQVIVYAVGLLAIGATLKIDVSSVIIGLGAVSIAISFALSTLINNLVAGFLLQADGSVRVGDNVSFGGIDGRVVRMRARVLMVVTKEGALVFVPNAYFLSNPIINRGRDTAR